jgi:hypothetical protein
MAGKIAPEKRLAWLAGRTHHGAYLGGIESSEHAIWRGMIARCHNPNSKDYPKYGAVGVVVCDKWRESYENFIADMGRKPSIKYQLDRYPDPNGNYEPLNTRWTTQSENQKNKRNTKRWVNEDGKIGTLSEWAEMLGISRELAFDRMKRWGTFEKGHTWQLLQKQP